MPGFPGFDISAYPGDSVMSWLKANTNLVWCGYYLGPTPSHPDTSWMGTREFLTAAGWGIAPLYVGQQTTGSGSHNPSTATGQTDGQDAADKMNSEGFPLSSYVYLDLENGPPCSQLLQDYVMAWCDTVHAGNYQPGIYCSHLLTDQVNNLRSDGRIWAFKIGKTKSHSVPAPYPTLDPSGSGFSGAYAWQHDQYSVISVPPAPESTLAVDLNSAMAVDPGAPDLT